ncbi:MAG: penicillin-binding protein 2 [Deltaproteobacteria bacterium]|nr:penicillin-binding protein 2 [Deltaproteobacteria bacterium]
MARLGEIESHYQLRIYGALVVAALLFALLLGRLWYLQIIKGEYFEDQSRNNRIRTIKLTGPRGGIYDREGRHLVQNRAQFSIALMLEDVVDLNSTLMMLAVVTGRPLEQIKSELSASKKKKKRFFELQIVIPDASSDEVAKVKANGYRLPGVVVDVSPTRIYPNGALASQVLGYTREISAKQLESKLEYGYKQGDVLGQTGIEYSYEQELRGRNGEMKVEVDAHGNKKKELAVEPGVPGKDLYLTLDIDIQRASEEALRDKSGAVVALDVKTGEVLAIASAPTYDANIFSGNVLANDWQRLTADPLRPLTNRALAGTYPPGSTFKLIVAVAALAENTKILPEKGDWCPGYFMLGRRYNCHKKEGHGLVDMQRAIEQSCNVFFYKLGLNLGIETIYKYGSMLGLGSVTGIGLQNEESGIMPNGEWKRKRFSKPQLQTWEKWDTLSVSIGQGFLNVTPIQLANAMATLVNGGVMRRPYLVSHVDDPDHRTRLNLKSTFEKKLPIPQVALDKVKAYAETVVMAERGTGKKARVSGVSVGGKTGTAQYASLDKEKKKDDHAWFISFAPVHDPMIALAVLVEHGGKGGVAAAPISQQVMQVYFRKKGMLIEDPKTVSVEGPVVDDEEAIDFEQEMDRVEDYALPDEREKRE